MSSNFIDENVNGVSQRPNNGHGEEVGDALCIPLSEQSLTARRQSLEQGRCDRRECSEIRRKLNDAMRANRAWETRFNDLHRESLTYTRALERQLQTRELAGNGGSILRPGPSSCDSADSLDLVRELERQLRDERQRSSALKRRMEMLEAETRALTEEKLKPNAKDREELALMREQLRTYKEDFEREKADKQRLKLEKDDIRRRMVVAQQQASISQANFLAVRREKDDLISSLRSLTNHAN